MADNFRASFVLALKDDLSGGLRRIIAEVKQFQSLVKSMGFRPLEGADAIVNKLDRDVQQLNRGLGATARQAESTAVAIRRIGMAELGRSQDTVSSLRREAAAARQAAAAAGFGGGASIPMGGGRPGSGSPLLLAGPGGGDAPFDERFNTLIRRRNPFAGMGARISALNEHVGLMGGMMAGVSLMGPIHEAAEFDNVLTHIAITAGATEGTVRTKVAAMAETYRAMALATRQSSHDVAESAQFLITTGIGEEMTNKLLPIIATAATAYNTPMRDAVQGAFSMHEELKIAPEDMQGALSATALAAKQGHFSFSDFSSFLPSIAAQAGPMGIRGREGLNTLLAALETSRRGAGTSGQAATNLQDFLGYINAPIGTKSFAKAGINLPGLKIAAEKAGQNPIEAVIEAVRRRTAGMSDAQRGTFLGGIFHNQEARIFANTMLNELQYYEDTRKKISQAGDQTIDEDFRKAQNLHTRLAELSESSHQLTQRIGTGFSWVVPVATGLLTGVLVGLHGIDHVMPGLADGVIAVTGGMLGLVAVMGVLGTVAGPVKAGFLLLRTVLSSVFSLSSFRMLVSPWLALPVLMGAAAYDILAHWSYFQRGFYRLWGGILQMLGGAQQFISGVFAGDMARAAAGLHTIWNGLKQAWTSVWGASGIMEKLFGDFATWVDGWSGGLASKLGGAMGQAFDALASTVKNGLATLSKLFEEFKPDFHLPTAPFMVPQGGPDSFPRYQAPAPANRDHDGTAGAMRARPSAYMGQTGGAAVQQIHVTFTSDTPGQASVEHSGGSGQARGRMLVRA